MSLPSAASPCCQPDLRPPSAETPASCRAPCPVRRHAGCSCLEGPADCLARLGWPGHPRTLRCPYLEARCCFQLKSSYLRTAPDLGRKVYNKMRLPAMPKMSAMTSIWHNASVAWHIEGQRASLIASHSRKNKENVGKTSAQSSRTSICSTSMPLFNGRRREV